MFGTFETSSQKNLLTREKQEDSIDFANRCKAAIAEAGGLVDRNWDGNLKVFSKIWNFEKIIF